MRIIPGKTKIRIELFKGVSLVDFLIGLAFVGLIVLAVSSPLNGKLYIVSGIIFIGGILLVKIGDEPNYIFFLAMLRHAASRKAFSKGAKNAGNIAKINAFKRIEDGFIVYNDYYGAVIEIPPVEFRFFSSYRRSMSIDDCLGNVLRSLNGSYAANLVKIERKVPYDSYIENEKSKLEELRRCFECALINEEEYQAKCDVIFDRLNELETLNSETHVISAYYYLVLFDADKNQLRLQIDSAVNVLTRGEMQPKRLNSRELALFLRYNNEIDFDESELDELDESEYAAWAMPESLKLKAKTYQVNDMTAYTMAVSNYPLRVGDAWLAGVMSIPATKVVVKLQPMDKQKTVRNIDRSISELRARYNASGVDSTLIELSDHIQSLTELLGMLQSDNEVLLNTDIYVTCYDAALSRKEGREQELENSSRTTINNMRAVVRRYYREDDLRLSTLQFGQMEGYIGSQISGYDPLSTLYGRGIPGSTAAAMYPWIYAHVQDSNGIKLGSEDGIPVFIDLFRRDSERVNSNMVIVGKTGSGKSYAAKSILANLAADNSKIFVLDPENEYTELADNLHGKFINVGNAQQGRMNPFQIITSLDDDADEEGITVTGSFASHMQFLEEFFRQILPDCEKEALEYLNSLADRVYLNRGITAETNLSQLSPEDFPIFDDLYDEILKEFQVTENEYLRALLRTLMNYVSKFSAGGRNANIWNGPSTITTDENFTVFNFQSLLSGGNSTITNAQMMLVMKYIDNEIIKNREYNARYGTNRKIVVVIDEAHVFIDEKYPIALDFMFQLAKRIRKYNGMQIVITQNIKDFVGSEEISRKSSAIINACQYSFIFPLAPNDMDDLCKLYDKAGGINESEQEKIVTAPRGNAFVILSSTSRSSFQVEVPEDVVRIFEDKGVPSRYFDGEEGQARWEKYVGASREMYQSNRREKIQSEAARSAQKRPVIELIELSEEAYELEKLQERSEKSEKIPEVEKIEPPMQPAPMQEPLIQQSGNLSEERFLHMMSEFSRAMESMGRFSYDAMVRDIMSRLESVPAGTRSGGAADALPREEHSAQSMAAADYTAADEDDNISFFSSFFENAAEPGEEKSAPLEQSLEDYVQELAALANRNGESASGDNTSGAASEVRGSFSLFGDNGETPDVLSFLKQDQGDRQQIDVLELMRSEGEEVHCMSLNELIEFNRSRKNR